MSMRKQYNSILTIPLVNYGNLHSKTNRITIQKIRTSSKKGNKYSNTVVEKFLTDYDGSRKLEIPRAILFPIER